MKIFELTGTEDPASIPASDVQGSAITVGTFDGVHLGHLDVINHLVNNARSRGLVSIAVTFDPHPLQIVNPSAAPLLLTVGDEKARALSGSGLDYLCVLKFDHSLAALSAEDFVDRILIEKLHLKHLLVGHDHGFGRQRAGNPEVLKSLGSTRGFDVEVVDAVSTQGGRVVSSTIIRRAVAGGDIEGAQEMLGRPYAVSGIVVEGAQRGRSLGFPTLNLQTPDIHKLLPPDGVYAAIVDTPQGRFKSMVNIGGKPTFGDNTRTVEAYLMHAPEGLNLYSQHVSIGIVKRLRDVIRFDSPVELIARIKKDEIEADSVLKSL